LSPLYVKHNAKKQEQLDGMVQQSLEKEVVTRGANHEWSPSMHSYLFLRTKKTRGFCSVFNMRPLNKVVRSETFQMETTLLVAASIHPGSWARSLDFMDAYWHIPMHPFIQHRLCFTNGGEAHQFRVPTFELNVSAWVFTKATSIAVSFFA
jgi:hypothetical protein